jgi:hypothetical protein
MVDFTFLRKLNLCAGDGESFRGRPRERGCNGIAVSTGPKKHCKEQSRLETGKVTG